MKEGLEKDFFQHVQVPVYDWLIGNYWQQQELIEGVGAEQHTIMFPRAFAEHFLMRSALEEERRNDLLEQMGDAAMVPGTLDNKHNIAMNFSYGDNFSEAAKGWCDGG